MKNKLIILFFALTIVFLIATNFCWGVDDVRILPLSGPIGTAAISPANGSATPYRMDFSGQKSICFKNIAATEVYLSSASSIGLNGYPLLNASEAICMDLTGGTTVYFYGNGAGASIRAIFAR